MNAFKRNNVPPGALFNKEPEIDESGLNSFAGNEDQWMNEQIRKKAYELAEQRGFTPGHELDDWLEAEQCVKSVR